MGTFFSDEVERALQYIYYDVRKGKGAEGFALLEKASAAGDGDASCILARCLNGSNYVWGGHDFPEDEARATRLIRKSVEQGSALGVLVAMRCGELTPEVERKMPFASLQEAFDIVLQKAKDGDAFCQYTVGNSYFWWDFVRIQGKSREDFSSDAEYKAWLRDNISKCEDWFQKALRGGIHFAANNLNHYYTKGDEDLIAPRPELAKNLYRDGAEKGHPLLQYIHGDHLMEEGKKEEALHWYREAAEGGQLECWYLVGRQYEQGEIVPKDLAYAASCYEKGLAQKNHSSKKTGCANVLGAMYYNGEGVERNYEKAFELLSYAWTQGSKWGACYLGKCCYYGQGTKQDYRKAREYLEAIDWENKEAFYLLGNIYGQGLGVVQNAEKGAMYLKRAGDFPAAVEELKKYKKSIFGKWSYKG